MSDLFDDLLEGKEVWKMLVEMSVYLPFLSSICHRARSACDHIGPGEDDRGTSQDM
jgi:hypothetical protein